MTNISQGEIFTTGPYDITIELQNILLNIYTNK